jgi:carbon-monoxide dehydrogenase large subunit
MTALPAGPHRPDGIGSPLRRVEDPRLITGRGRYVDDIRLPGTLHAVFVRSPLAHALVRSIDTAEAAHSAGVVGVWTSADLRLDRPMPSSHPHPAVGDAHRAEPIVTREVCYAGQAVAVIVAESAAAAVDAAEQVWVDYESLPAVADLRAAAGGATPVHQGDSTNLVTRLHTRFGDADRAFDDADVVLGVELLQHRGAGASMETRGVLAHRQGHRTTVWSSTQSAYPLQRLLAEYFGIDVRVIAPDVGGGFGPKGAIYAEEYAITALAGVLDAPVKWIETRREHLQTTHQQRDMISTLEVAAAADGTLLGLRGRILMDNGAYVPYGITLPMTGIQLIQGPYTLAAMDISTDMIYTNAVPTSPIRGAARPNAIFMIERVIDAVADRLGLDRAEIRRRNFIPADRFPYQFPLPARYGGMITYDSGDYHATLEAALELSDREGFDERRRAAATEGRRLGMGIAAYVEDTGLGPHEKAIVRLDDDGRVEVVVGTGSQGQGHATVFSQIAADALGVHPYDVIVRTADTDLGGTGGSTVASRTAVTAGSSTHAAAGALALMLRRLAAEELEAGVDDLVLEDGFVKVRGQPGAAIPFARLKAAAVERGEDAVAEAAVPASRPPYAFGCHVAEVEVDAETGMVTVHRYSVAHDCGTILNQMIVDGQIDGGVAHGISNALYERVVYSEDGQPLTTSFMDFRIPTAMEMPHLSKVHTVTPAVDYPLGAKGAGEGGTIPAAAAIVSAVEDALSEFGVRIDRYPLIPSVVRRIVEDAQAL